MPPTVSVNLCCYNSEKYLRETMDSIVGQTYKDWELIIINDGSNDATASIVQEYVRKGYPISYFFQENKGLGYSRNRALEHSQGEYVAFIDHDDMWLPSKLEKQIELLKNRPDVDFVYSNHFKKTAYSKKRMALGLKGKQPEGFVFVDFIHKYQVSVSTVVVTRKSLSSLGTLFDERFNHIEEYDVFMRLLYTHNAAYVDEALAVYRIHENMLSIRSPEVGPRECQYLLERFTKMDPMFAGSNPDVVDYLNIQLIKYSQAKLDILNGKLKDARQRVAPHKWYSGRLFLTYVASFFPYQLSSFLNQAILALKRIF